MSVRSAINLRRVRSNLPISGSGFHVEHGDNSNVFTGCQADLSAGAHSCFRIGGGARRTHVVNLFTKASGTVDNLALEPGADETTVINLHAASAGAAVADFSGGTTIAVNAGWPVRVRLPRTHITELEVGQLTTGTLKHAVAYIENLATYDVAVASRVHLISAWSGPVTARLPAPGGTVGYLVTLKKSDASANGVTVIDAEGGKPDGQTTVLTGHGDFVTVVSNGAAWWIVGRSG